MQLTTIDINNRYNEGVGYLTDITNSKFLRSKYGVQFLGTGNDTKLLMLLTELESWDNRPGALNVLDEYQMIAILDNIRRYGADELANNPPSADKLATPGFSSSQQPIYFSVANTSSVNLSVSNSILSANVKLSGATGNKAVLNYDGIYVADSGTVVKFLQGSDFNAGTNEYDDPTMAGKKLQIWHRGLGFLLYNYNNPSDPNNEFTILPTGGFIITISGFNVHDGNNYFHVII